MAQKPVELIRSRIVGYKTVRASELTAHPLNWRTHPQKQRDAVQASLRELGWIAPVVVSVNSGYLIDGHERVWQALKNDEEVPVLEVDLSEAEEKLALTVFDPITGMAKADSAVLASLLQEVSSGEAALQELIATLGQGMGDAEKEMSPAKLGTERVIEIHCSADDVAAFGPVLSEWCERPGVELKILWQE